MCLSNGPEFGWRLSTLSSIENIGVEQLITDMKLAKNGIADVLLLMLSLSFNDV
jgi:hypothetical protein